MSVAARRNSCTPTGWIKSSRHTLLAIPERNGTRTARYRLPTDLSALRQIETDLGLLTDHARPVNRPRCTHQVLTIPGHCHPRLRADICLTKRNMTNPVMTAAVASANGSITADPVLGSATFRAFQSSLLDSTDRSAQSRRPSTTTPCESARPDAFWPFSS